MFFFFFQAEDGIRDLVRSRGLGDVYKRQVLTDPERVRKRAHDLVATSAEFLDASWSNAVSGNAVPVDLQGILGTASYWLLEDVRAHALETGRPWWSLTSFGACLLYT